MFTYYDDPSYKVTQPESNGVFGMPKPENLIVFPNSVVGIRIILHS